MLKITAITQENLEELSKANAYKVPKDIPIILHNASYDTHFIINQLAEEFRGELNSMGKIWKNISLFLYRFRNNVMTTK